MKGIVQTSAEETRSQADWYGLLQPLDLSSRTDCEEHTVLLWIEPFKLKSNHAGWMTEPSLVGP